jgi:hypothetical protein
MEMSIRERKRKKRTVWLLIGMKGWSICLPEAISLFLYLRDCSENM